MAVLVIPMRRVLHRTLIILWAIPVCSLAIVLFLLAVPIWAIVTAAKTLRAIVVIWWMAYTIKRNP